MDDIIQVASLHKSFGTLHAVSGISFSVKKGECLAILGPNGAGKSTTIKMLYGRLLPEKGSVTVLGMDVKSDGRRVRNYIGVVPQDNNVDPDITALENLVIYGRYYGIKSVTARKKALELMDFFKLGDKLKGKADNLSGGQKRRLIIARGLMNSPPVLILDEPTTGLDPQARNLVWERLSELKKQGITVLITTHYMDEAEKLCDRIIILDEGKIIIDGAPRGLIESIIGREVVEVEFDTPEEMKGFMDSDFAKGIKADKTGPATLMICGNNGKETAGSLENSSFKTCRIYHRMSNLEDVFLKLTGRTLE